MKHKKYSQQLQFTRYLLTIVVLIVVVGIGLWSVSKLPSVSVLIDTSIQSASSNQDSAISSPSLDTEKINEPSIESLQHLNLEPFSSQSSLKKVVEEAQYILDNRTINNTSCSTNTKINNEEGWNEYRNHHFNYILKYPAYLFSIKEYNECAHIEFIPSYIEVGDNYSPVHEFYVRVLAIKTDFYIQPQQWAAHRLNNNLVVSSFFRNVDAITDVNKIEAIEIGPVPGIVDENIVIISTTDTLFEIIMYPAPIQPGQEVFPSNTTPSSRHLTFIENFYQMLNSFHRF